jgi:hypothetical protein
MIHWAREFADGFLRPSRLSAGVALACFGLTLGLALWFFSEPVLSGPLGRFLAKSDRDAEARATYRVLQLRSAPPDRPELLVLGSSAMANAVASERGMENELYQSTGRRWSVSILTTPAQSLLDQLTLIDVALGPAPGPRRPVLIVVEMSALREEGTARRTLELERMGRLGVRSDWADQVVRELGATPRPRSVFYPAENYDFVLIHGGKSLLRLLLGSPARVPIAVYGPPSPLPPEKRDRRKILAEITGGRVTRTLTFRVLDQLLRRLRAYPNVHVVLAQTRLSPQFGLATGSEDLQSAAEARAQSFAADHGTEYWPVFTEANVSPDAFYDDIHIATAPDRDRIRKALAGHIARLVKSWGLG